MTLINNQNDIHNIFYKGGLNYSEKHIEYSKIKIKLSRLF